MFRGPVVCGKSGKCLRTAYSIIASSAATTNAVRAVNTNSRIASSVLIAVSGKQRSRSSISTMSCLMPASFRSLSNALRKASTSSGTFLVSAGFNIDFTPSIADARFSFVASLPGSANIPSSVPTMALIWSGVGMPVKAVIAKPPARFATFNQSMRLKTSLTAPPAFVSAGRFSTRPVTMPSINAILASSKP